MPMRGKEVGHLATVLDRSFAGGSGYSRQPQKDSERLERLFERRVCSTRPYLRPTNRPTNLYIP